MPQHHGSVSRGTLVVLLMIFLGIVAGSVAVAYWLGVLDRSFPGKVEKPTAVGAGAVAWNPAVALEEVEALEKRYEAAMEAGNMSGVVADAQRAVERFPGYAAAHRLLGLALLNEGKLAAAYDQLRLSLDGDKRQPEVHLVCGTLARTLERPDDAAKHYAAARDLRPEEPRYRLHLAQHYIERRDFDRGRMELLDALRLDSSQHRPYALLSDLEARQNNLDQALVQIQRAIERTPIAQRKEQVEYIRTRARLLRRANKPEESLQVLRALSASEQTDAAVMEDLARTWAMLEQPAEAAAVYERALRSNPMNHAAAAEAARWRMKAGDRAAAQQLINAIRTINARLPVIAELEAELAKLP